MNFNELSKLTDAELTKLLREQIKIKQANGTMGEIEKMVRAINPYLTAEQRSRLSKIFAAANED